MARRAAKKKTTKKKTTKKARSTSRRKKASAAEMLLVGSKVKQALRSHKVNVASDAAESLNYVVHWYINQAAKRASANGRKTVRAHDFMIG